MIYLPSLNWEEERSAKILSFVLEKICFEEHRSTVVICNNMQEVKLVAYAIHIIENYEAIVYSPHLQLSIPNLEEKQNVVEKIRKSKLNVLVTDSRAMCGFESEVVIVFVKPEEYLLRHVIVDTCAKSNSNLIFLILPSKDVVLQECATVEDVLNKWTKKDEEDKEEKVLIIHVKVSNDKKDLWLQSGQFVNINDQCDMFNDRGAGKNFIEYIENEGFKTNPENELL